MLRPPGLDQTIKMDDTKNRYYKQKLWVRIGHAKCAKLRATQDEPDKIKTNVQDTTQSEIKQMAILFGVSKCVHRLLLGVCVCDCSRSNSHTRANENVSTNVDEKGAKEDGDEITAKILICMYLRQPSVMIHLSQLEENCHNNPSHAQLQNKEHLNQQHIV